MTCEWINLFNILKQAHYMNKFEICWIKKTYLIEILDIFH